jgi:peptidoglycan/LPS O-acetylase OafA/YrhL
MIEVDRNWWGKDALHALWNPPKSQIPALDALRTLAVLLVVSMHFTHFYTKTTASENAYSRLPFVRGGWMGVDLFFLLSGFLIGTQLWKELGLTGNINLKRFVLRRGLRIWPLYFFFFLFVIVVLHRGDFPYGRWWSDLFFVTNYINKGVVMGSWSLSSEEQFYILAPVVILLAFKYLKRIEDHRVYLWALILFFPVVRAIVWWRVAGSLMNHDTRLFFINIYTPIHTHADGLVAGLLVANYLFTKSGPGPKFFRSPWILVAAAGICLVLQRLHREVFDFTGLTLVLGLLMCLVLQRPELGRSFFKWRGFYVLSRLSYGMYLNHEYIHEPLAKWTLRYLPLAKELPALHNILSITLLVAMSAIIAVVTFTLIEHPFIAIRARVIGAPNANDGDSDRRVVCRGGVRN